MRKLINIGVETKSDGKRKPKHEKNNAAAHEAYVRGKNAGRPRQVWVWDVWPAVHPSDPEIKTPGIGHWEKEKA